MPRSSRKTYDNGFKTRVVLEALKETMTLNELGAKYEVHPNQIMQWKSKFLELAPGVFDRNPGDRQELKSLRHENETLVHQIGELSVANNFLKKNLKKLNLL